MAINSYLIKTKKYCDWLISTISAFTITAAYVEKVGKLISYIKFYCHSNCQKRIYYSSTRDDACISKSCACLF